MAIKQSRGITIGKGTPQRLEGQNGDMTIRSSRRGLKLYVKESNKWHSLDLGIDLRQIASTVRKLEDEVKRLSNKTNNTPVVDKILLRQPGGTSAVGIQNKSGNIAFRNSTDTADGKLQSIPFDTGTNNTGGKGWGQFYYDSSSSSHYLESNGLIIVTQLNAPDATEQASILMMSKGADSIVRFNEQVNSKFIMGYDHLKADGSTSDARFKIDTAGSFSDDSVFNLDANGIYVIGKVGIGTTSPDSNLHIKSSSATQPVLQLETALDGGGADTFIRFGDSTENYSYALGIDDSSNTFRLAYNGSSYNGAVLGTTDLITVSTAGNVGIGTTSPTTTLDVNGTVSYKHTAFTTAEPTDNVDVSDTTVLEVDTSSNNVVIGGFTGGVQGQILHIVKTNTANFIQLEHNETAGNQNIYLTSGSDERVVGYGGYTLYCNGLHWYSLSNPTGAADAG